MRNITKQRKNFITHLRKLCNKHNVVMVGHGHYVTFSKKKNFYNIRQFFFTSHPRNSTPGAAHKMLQKTRKNT